jgi:hypothetical protein
MTKSKQETQKMRALECATDDKLKELVKVAKDPSIPERIKQGVIRRIQKCVTQIQRHIA